MSFVLTIRLLATILPGFAVLLTLLRLYYRWSRRHLGYDDAWAAFAVVCSFFMCAGAWTRSDTPATGPFHHSHRVRVIGYYMLNVSFTCVLWASRMSILFSIIRLIPSLLKLRIYAHLSAVLFGLMWTALLIHKIAVCESNPAWKQSPGVQCVLGHGVGAFELATDILADLILVFLPMRLLWRIKLPRGKRILLQLIFSASMFTTIVSIIHGVYVFSTNRNGEGILAHIEASTALIVSNFAVLLTWLMRSLGHAQGSEDAPDTGGAYGSQRKQMTSLRFWSRNQTAPIVLTGLSGSGTTMTAMHTRMSGESAEVPPTDVEDGRSRKSFNMTLGKAM
ncbi:uncharacterized protein TRAVEDRAFT_171208 [Trametes versicolor FP-101664 SS1]|uniref:uncharacterized protein n=1 Tax=Trametes versicolor (strain FP-101664) TaxID=717944 RepID=UPI00046225E9|nr:uncharacterized protein TRAVEDRAFT_171208 [Trametes versicolor FP-101664 SS1]EIW55505.1 hypothetical protein TRAVEDRAFT_171208 [Trametes versicolor FP-101664 SS1]